MEKIRLIGWNEIITLVRRPSFIFATFGLPIFSALLIIIISYLNQGGNDTLPQLAELGMAMNPVSNPQSYFGLVDNSGLIESLPDNLPDNLLKPIASEERAKQALVEGEISGYFLIPNNYIENGNIAFLHLEGTEGLDDATKKLFEYSLVSNLLEGNRDLADQFARPFDPDFIILSEEPAIDTDDPMYLLLPYGVTILYYVLILTSSSLLLSSVTKEKENRLMEILLSSTTPRQLLSGKIIGLGLVGLFQTIIWISSGYILFNLSGLGFDLPTSFQLPADFILWGVLFFLMGYALYASLMAAIGALVPNLREATHATMVVISPMIIPIMMTSVIVARPNDWIAVALSYFPFTAPVTMMTRHSITSVPLWQSITSLILLLITVYLIVRSVANLFHAQTLLSGQSFGLKRLISALIWKP